MGSPENIAVVNVEWSDDYTGSETTGYYGGYGSEAFNFLPFNGHFYGYIPPTGGFPKNRTVTDWIVFFTSKCPDSNSHVVVGWFENAAFTDSKTRPDSASIGVNKENAPFTYSVVASAALAIPAALRDCVLPKGTIFRGFSYVRRDGVNKSNQQKLIRILLAYRDAINANRFTGTKGKVPPGTGGFCLDVTRRKEIETAAVDAVKRDYAKGYSFKDRQMDGCGYDLEFDDKRTREKWCIEVKGASGSREVFIISPNERNVGQKMEIAEEIGVAPLEHWRLALVTNATNSEQRKIIYYTSNEIESKFDFTPMQWQATLKS